MSLFSRFKKSQKEDAPVDEAASNPSPPPAASAPNTQDVLAALKQKISELSDGQVAPEAIDPSAILFDFGYVDSLTAVTLIAWIDEQWAVSVTELDLVGALNNLGALADHVEQGRGS